ncbi:hypothetical protein Ancab_040536 [Ancistrocladus abbreviatus]
MERLLASLFCALLLLLLVLKFVVPSRNTKSNLPPSPTMLPIIGNLHQMSKMPHLTFSRMAKKLGPIFFLQLGNIPTVVISSASLAKEVLKTQDHAFASRPKLLMAKRIIYDCLDIGFCPSSPNWRNLRRICIVELLSPRMVQAYEYVRKEEVSRLVQRVAASSPGTVNLSKMLSQYAKDVLCRVVLGRNYTAKGDFDRHRFPEMLEEMKELLGLLSIGEFFPSMEFLDILTGQRSRADKLFQNFDTFLNEVIDEHLDPERVKPKEKDLLDVLLSIQKDGTSDIPLTMNNIKAVLMDMFVAGTDTTFITLDWAMTELLMNPSIMKKVQAEVRSILGERKLVSQSDLRQMHYLRAVVKETFRMHPAVPLLLPRESVDDATLNGYQIPAKTRVFVNAWAIGRDPQLWEDPNTFSPDRFMDSDIDFKGLNFELIPFGAGRRVCPGLTFGLASIETGLAQLLHAFDWEFPPGVEAKDLDLNEVFGVTLEKSSDTIAVAKARFA